MPNGNWTAKLRLRRRNKSEAQWAERSGRGARLLHARTYAGILALDQAAH